MGEKSTEQHRNDIYGDLSAEKGAAPTIPAATVVLLRDAVSGPEVLMLRKTSKIHFGGMWVFPGGRIDGEDYPQDRDLETAARTAAAREAHEEAGIQALPDDFVWFAHWQPPTSTPKRFSTWFFAAEASEHAVKIDGGEIDDHSWITPAKALDSHRAGEIDLAPPTWVTLYHLSRYSPTAAVLEQFRSRKPKFYHTHVGVRDDGVRVCMWTGDAGYEQSDADATGERHRLVMAKEGFDFVNSIESY